MLNETQASKPNISPQRPTQSMIKLESADLKGMPTVRMSANFLLSISVARRFGERMFSFLALRGANGNFGAPANFYAPLQEARFIVVHRRLYINKALWTIPCVVTSIVHTLQLGIIRSECP